MMHKIATGFRVTAQNKRMVAIFYLFNFLMGLILMLPWRATIATFGGHSLLMRQMGGAFNVDFIIDLTTQIRTFIPVWATVIGAGILVYQLIQLFLSGGALSIYLQGGKYQSTLFWGNSARYFGRFIRLALWSFLLLAVFVAIDFVFKGLQRLVWGKHPYETIIYWNKVFRILLLQFFIIVYTTVLDYSRLLIIHHDLTVTRNALLQGIRFVGANFGITIGIALSFFALTGISLLIYNWGADLLKSPHWIIILFLFVWQQMYMAGRLFLRLTLYGAEAAVYQERAS